MKICFFKIVVVIFLISFTFLNCNPKKEITFKHFSIEAPIPYQGIYLYIYEPFPLPAKDFVKIKIFWDANYSYSEIKTEVYNTAGVKICGDEKITLNPESNWYGTAEWNSSGQRSGIYIIKFTLNSVSKTTKVIIN